MGRAIRHDSEAVEPQAGGLAWGSTAQSVVILR